TPSRATPAAADPFAQLPAEKSRKTQRRIPKCRRSNPPQTCRTSRAEPCWDARECLGTSARIRLKRQDRGRRGALAIALRPCLQACGTRNRPPRPANGPCCLSYRECRGDGDRVTAQGVTFER